ncbi:CGNR zinc finger domain-containing protein [Saccharopolyspora cebuensis]|uniref:CGNR zinc finger domain-containing protein n=1 Tax=Saccharopolyspora cebuensis TaxID=418759 RepID=A0ABV4CE11_9PSEU
MPAPCCPASRPADRRRNPPRPRTGRTEQLRRTTRGRWCSTAVCGDREKARRHYRRTRRPVPRTSTHLPRVDTRLPGTRRSGVTSRVRERTAATGRRGDRTYAPARPIIESRSRRARLRPPDVHRAARHPHRLRPTRSAPPLSPAAQARSSAAQLRFAAQARSSAAQLRRG